MESFETGIEQLGQFFKKDVNPSELRAFIAVNTDSINDSLGWDQEFQRLKLLGIRGPRGSDALRDFYNLITLTAFAMSGFKGVRIKRSVLFATLQVVFGWLEVDLPKEHTSHRSKSEKSMRRSIINQAHKIKKAQESLVSSIKECGLPDVLFQPAFESHNAMITFCGGLDFVVFLNQSRTARQGLSGNYLRDHYGGEVVRHSLRFAYQTLIEKGWRLRGGAKNWEQTIFRKGNGTLGQHFTYFDQGRFAQISVD